MQRFLYELNNCCYGTPIALLASKQILESGTPQPESSGLKTALKWGLGLGALGTIGAGIYNPELVHNSLESLSGVAKSAFGDGAVSQTLHNWADNKTGIPSTFASIHDSFKEKGVDLGLASDTDKAMVMAKRNGLAQLAAARQMEDSKVNNAYVTGQNYESKPINNESYGIVQDKYGHNQYDPRVHAQYNQEYKKMYGK